MPQSWLWSNILLSSQWTILVTAPLTDSIFILWPSLLLTWHLTKIAGQWWNGFEILFFPFSQECILTGKGIWGKYSEVGRAIIILQVPLLCPHVHLAHIQCPRASGSWEAHSLAGKMPKSGNILTQELEIEVKRNMMHSAFSWHAGDLISWPYIIDMEKKPYALEEAEM